MEILKELNLFLADLNVFYRKLQNYHWNVEGRDFFTVHAKLEEYYNEINEQIDEIAEHILILGGQPLGRLTDYLENSQIKETENKKVTSDIIFRELIRDYNTLEGQAIKIKEAADKEGEYGTSSMMDEYIQSYTKKLWMMNQMMG